MALILDTIEKPGSSIYYGSRFRLMLEDHLQYILALDTNQIRMIGEEDLANLHKYVGDFYGFLDSLSYDKRYHWAIMRANGFRSRFDLKESLMYLIIPDYAFLDKLAQLSKEKRK